MAKGWHRESRRHALARAGVRTARSKNDAMHSATKASSKIERTNSKQRRQTLEKYRKTLYDKQMTQYYKDLGSQLVQTQEFLGVNFAKNDRIEKGHLVTETFSLDGQKHYFMSKKPLPRLKIDSKTKKKDEEYVILSWGTEEDLQLKNAFDAGLFENKSQAISKAKKLMKDADKDIKYVVTTIKRKELRLLFNKQKGDDDSGVTDVTGTSVAIGTLSL